MFFARLVSLLTSFCSQGFAWRGIQHSTHVTMTQVQKQSSKFTTVSGHVQASNWLMHIMTGTFVNGSDRNLTYKQTDTAINGTAPTSLLHGFSHTLFKL